jgi:hypothetical protein
VNEVDERDKGASVDVVRKDQLAPVGEGRGRVVLVSGEAEARLNNKQVGGLPRGCTK